MEEDLKVDVGNLPEPSTSFKTAVTDKIKRGARRTINKFTTRDGLLGDYDYAFIFTPQLPFMKKPTQPSPYFGLNSNMPVALGVILGLQHSLAMLAGVVAPPIIVGNVANLETADIQYLVSNSLILSGLLSLIQIVRFHIYKTPFYLGTGLISVVGTSFATISVVTGAFPQMYKSGFCPSDEHGNPLPCPEGYGALVGTCALGALLQIASSFCPPKILQKIFPPLVTGPVVLLIGLSLAQTGMRDWAGGSGNCFGRPDGFYSMCPDIDAPHPLPWGSAQFVGLGFLVFVTIILCEKWGAPIMRSCSVIIGLLVGCIVAAGCGYFDGSSIEIAPVASFLWVRRFPLKIYGPIVMPILAVYITIIMETIGTITATCDVSRQDVEGPVYESRIQGGLLADGINGVISGVAYNTPFSTFAQNNGVIAITKCANRTVGFWCCLFLLLEGVFAKFGAALVAIPSAVLGGMTTFLFTSVAVSGIRIISTIEFTNRNRFILTCSCMFGFATTLVPDWFSYVFTYSGPNTALTGFYDAIQLVLETSFAIAGFTGVILNQLLKEEAKGNDEVATAVVVEGEAMDGSSITPTRSEDMPPPKA
ncbi:hypothetical protein TRVA0_019S01376 [Trichomonascus vanleenenianus]|uniref:nucleobase:cation symporter-2 family protein n=1 Tax=Trichomonascus vanleenenianus TaxID=2268995 RepID=UPI003ECB91D0